MKTVLVAFNSKFVHTNLAIRYIKSYCKDYDIEIKEYTINDSIWKAVQDIYESKPDIVGFSCYIWNIEIVLKTASSLKRICPEMVIVLGGPEVSFDSIELMNRYPQIDYIIRGEGELSSLQLFDFLEGRISDIRKVGNLVYRSNGSIFENRMIDLYDDLDTLPFPYHGSDQEFKNKILYYESSRGCPYNCAYCLSSTIKGVRFLSLERVKRDLTWFIENDIELVKFVDRTFNCGRYYKDILRFLIENKKNTRFHFEISGEILDDETIDILNSAPHGLFQLEIGVQTTNYKALKNINRHSDFDRLSYNINRLIKKGNMHIHLDLIAGLPGEDYRSFAKSFNDVFNLKPHMLQLGFLKVLKGSRIRDHAEKFGIIYEEHAPYQVLKTKELSFEDMIKLKEIEDINDKYSNSGRFKASLMYIDMIFNDPFFMFEKMAEYMRQRGLKYKNIGNIEQYKFLFDFSKAYGIEESIIKDCLLFDYLRQGRNPVIPEFLNNKEQVDKNFLWDFANDEERVRKYIPHYRGLKSKEILKNIQAASFSFDICYFLNTQKINMNKTIVIFDYENKDEVSGVRYFSID